MTRRIFIVDNYDSFTFNIEHGLAAAGACVAVERADRCSLAAITDFAPDVLVLSPGPGAPEDAAFTLQAIERFAGNLPIFGVCLGLQCLAIAFGGAVERGEPTHGKTSAIRHDGTGIFEGLPQGIKVGRYHSLCVARVPEVFSVSAATAPDGVPMALGHKTLPIAGTQFHPESFLTEHGAAMLRHVVAGKF